MIPVEVTKISFYPPSKGYAVVLQETGKGSRKLLIIVGSNEAQAIALALEQVTTPRPMTHDLIADILRSTQMHMSEVSITELNGGTFFAEITLEKANLERMTIDSRPSDAIAVALRLGTPIFVEDAVMQEAGFTEERISGEEAIEEKNQSNEDSIKALIDKLQEAIDEEAYETAAELRDKIKKLTETKS